LALVQQRCGLSAAARETLERGLVRFGDHAPMHLAIGTMFEAQGSHDVAAWHYQIATECDAQSAENWWRLGHARLEIADYQSAASALERALKLDSRSAGAHAAFADLFAQTDDMSAALIHSQQAIAIEPNNPTAHARHGDILARLRRFDEAYQALGQAVALAPANHELLAQYGEIALNIGRDRQALEAFESAIKLRPEEASYHYYAGLAHRRLKHYSRAIEQYRRAVGLKPNYGAAIRELSTLGPLAFVAQYIRGVDDAVA